LPQTKIVSSALKPAPVDNLPGRIRPDRLQIQKVIANFQKVIGQEDIISSRVAERSAQKFLALTATRGGQKMIPQTGKLDEHIAIPKRPPASEAFVPEPLLDTDQAAAIMRIHPKTLQKLARRGVIRAIQIGKVWRFRPPPLKSGFSKNLLLD
jgi:excisionase family DNA binding protein